MRTLSPEDINRYGNADQSPLTIQGQVRLPLIIESPTTDMVSHEFLVTPSLGYDVILGRDFFEKVGIGLYIPSHDIQYHKKYKQAIKHSKDEVRILTVAGDHLVCHISTYSDTTCMVDHFKQPEGIHEVEVYEEPDEDADIKLNNDLTNITDPRVRHILENHPSIITSELSSTPCSVDKHHIELVDGTKPYKRSYYRIGPKERQFLDTEIARLIALGVVAPSRSSWGSPVATCWLSHWFQCPPC
jgi:hypothetical protein